MSAIETPWDQIQARIRELTTLTEVVALLEWDQQTMMPSGGAPHRGAHMSAVTGLLHERLADPTIGEWLDAVNGTDDPVQRAAIRKLRRRYERATRVPVALIRALSEAATDGFGAWLRAKEDDDFGSFQPYLERLVDLRREEVSHLGPAAHPYDHLLDEFDPGTRTADLVPLFDRLAGALTDFIQAVQDRPAPSPLNENFDVQGQARLSEQVLLELGFRMEDGRLDRAAHPFTVSMGTGDVRLTTRYVEDDLLSGLGGTIHECGHGMYEQGLPKRWADSGLAEAAGMAMHESQSRFWENTIGRSLPFFRWLVPLIREQWPDTGVTPESLYGAANRVVPSLVRVEADEVTYNLHIAIRFELEIALFEGQLAVRDLPDAWNAAYAERLGVTPSGPAEGVLQDVHWAAGMFGYFPSYTVGNLYAASLRFRMEEDLPGVWDDVERGDFQAVLSWLRKHVHDRGQFLDAPDLFREIVGDRDPVDDLMAHIRSRHGALYGIA